MARRTDLAQSPGAEAAVFGGAVVTIAVLLVWWAVFANRLIDDREELTRELVAVTAATPEQRTRAEEQLASEVARQRFMINGEGGVFGAMLLVATSTLFVV